MKTARRAHAGRLLSVLVFATGSALLGACSAGDTGPTTPTWTPLARDWSPKALEGELGLLEGLEQRLDDERGGVWIDRHLERADFHHAAAEPGNVWYAPMPPFGGSRHVFGLRFEVVADGRAIEPLNHEDIPPVLSAPLQELTDKSLSLRLPPGQETPSEVRVSTFLSRGFAEEGVWRAIVEGKTGEGLAVWPGEETTITADIPPESVLRFRIDGTAWDASTPPARFEVRLDGEPCFAEELDLAAGGDGRLRVVSLPAEGRARARLTFRVVGKGGTSAFFAPTIGPREIGTPAARPWGETKPDLLLFVADTFRADNVAVYGGDPGLTPHLNELAERSLRFLNARSPSTSTLPAHSSLFTGLFPTQHGATNKRALSRKLPRLAQRLHAAGYRTAAVSDSGFVSRQFGMDVGFESFDERSCLNRPLVELLEDVRRARAADDGRPLFLFVQTYRVHNPYRSGLEEDQSDRRAFLEEMRAYFRARKDEVRSGRTMEDILGEVYATHGARYRDLYLAGVRAFDEAVGPFFSELEAEDYAERGYFVFTGDHGEEFFEHGGRGHGGPAFEERVRVPLLLRGPGIAPGDVAWSCSLLDIAPTLLRLAGLEPLPRAVGRDLLGLDAERPMLFFNASHRGEFLVALDGGHKLFFEEPDVASSPVRAAYDLEADPRESVDLLPEAPAWIESMRARLAPLWTVLGAQVEAAEEADLDPGLAEHLRALGYAE